MFSFIGDVFRVLIGQPIFNLLVIIVALLPGHNLGWAIIIFTLIIRLLLYPLLKKQLHHAMAMKRLQPEMRRIKKEAKGNRQLESQMMMALYKEKEVNPFGSIGIILIQFPILLALYFAIINVIRDPNYLLNNAYAWVKDLPYMKELAEGAAVLNEVFLSIDLTKAANSAAGIYWPALILVIASVIAQYYQSRQLLLTDKKSPSLRQIFKDTATGKEVDQMEIQAATSKFTLYIIPFVLFIVAINFPAALSLYWFAGALIAIVQQTRILKKDVAEMEASVAKKPIEAEIVKDSETKPKTKNKKTKKNKAKKRRR